MELTRSHEEKDFVVTVSLWSKTTEGHSMMSDAQYDLRERLGDLARGETKRMQGEFDVMEKKHG